MFKVNNKDTRTTPLCSSGSIVNFEQVNADWLSLLLNLNMLKLSTHPKNACSKSALKMQDHGPVSLFLNVNTYLLREIDAFFSQQLPYNPARWRTLLCPFWSPFYNAASHCFKNCYGGLYHLSTDLQNFPKN